MQIDEPDGYPAGAHATMTPVYWVDSWSLTGDFIVKTERVRNAVDVQAVEKWAQGRYADQYVIYCEASSADVAPELLRVSGYEPYTSHEPVEQFVSDPDKAQRMREAIEAQEQADRQRPGSDRSPWPTIGGLGGSSPEPYSSS